MLFNSAVYIFAFLPTVFVVWALLSRFAPGQIVIFFLTAASLFFYGWWYPGFLPIPIGIVLLNYAVARRLFRELDPTRRWLLAAFGIAANLLVLFWFKYLNFAAYNVSTLLGLGVPDTVGPVFLPLGISFITLSKDRLPRRHVPRQGQGHQFLAILPVCFVFPAADCRTDSSPQRGDAAVRRSCQTTSELS
jgi:D-alanyl-lipoteichoic acid acyltransferase DltB (MBOAT superfamily)